MKTLIKISLITFISLNTLHAKEINTETLDHKVISFSKNILNKYKNSGLNVERVEILSKAKVSNNEEYQAYIMGFDLALKNGAKTKTERLTDIFFVGKSGVISTQLFSIDGKNLKDETIFNVKDNYYNKEHLLLGKLEYKNKIIIFSDYSCPFCQDTIEKMKKIYKNKEVGIYLVDYPLTKIHPAAPIIAAIAKQATRKGLKITPFDLYENRKVRKLTKETDSRKIIEKIKGVFSIEIDEKELFEIDMLDVNRDIKLSERVGVSKTPTLLLNGKRVKATTRLDNIITKYN